MEPATTPSVNGVATPPSQAAKAAETTAVASPLNNSETRRPSHASHASSSSSFQCSSSRSSVGRVPDSDSHHHPHHRTRQSLPRDDSVFGADEDFYDAHEDFDADPSRRTLSSSAELPPVTATDASHIVVDDTDGDASAASAASTDDSIDLNEHKFIVKNKDTGEVFDIRDLATQLPSDTYSIFPTDFLPPPHEDTTTATTIKRSSKPRRPSLTKLRLRFPLKPKTREATKRANVVPVLASKKEKREIDALVLAQTLARHSGTIWTMKFSHDGARLVSGGQDAVLRVWRVVLSAEEDENEGEESADRDGAESDRTTGEKQILATEPEQSYQGHTMPIVDVSWSRSNFILSASMDKTVRLWHISRDDCLHVFQHPDSVPAVDFHPKEDRYFLSGCFDNKARVWDIPDGCVVSYVQTPVMITAASFNPSGTRAIVGLLNGQCIFYQVTAHQQMTYYTQIECRNSRGPMKKGRKVTGIEFDPEGKSFLVSTNDSRMRLFAVDNYSRVCKYKGLVNDHLQIKGRFSQDGDYVICGSENGSVYVWNKASKQDRNASYEYFCAEPPNGIVTVALFAPASTFAMVKSKLEASDDMHTNACIGLLVTASYDGCIKFFERAAKS